MAVNEDGEAYMLFDVENDPSEQNNLAFDPAYDQIRSSLKEKMLERILSSQLRRG
jgi:hypothetical protein